VVQTKQAYETRALTTASLTRAIRASWLPSLTVGINEVRRPAVQKLSTYTLKNFVTHFTVCRWPKLFRDATLYLCFPGVSFVILKIHHSVSDIYRARVNIFR